MSEKAKRVLRAEATSIKAVAHDVAVSGAYIYPIKGILYFLSNRTLRTPLLAHATQTLTLGLSITTAMFFFTYLPQMTLMAFTSGPLAPLSAALLVLTESSTITNFLSRSFLFHDALLDTFDGTLVEKGQDTLVAQGRQLNPTSGPGSDAISRLGRLIKRPFGGGWFRPQALLRSLLYLPLNFVPVVGTVLYVYVQGKRVGPGLHARYFQLKGWNGRRREEWVGGRRGAYTGFGIAAFALEMVPFASIVFSFTNTVGAALWAADLEKGMQ